MEHNVVDEVCTRCGAVRPGAESTCVPGNKSPKLMPEPARRDFAFEDIDFINSRIIQLKAERQQILNQSDEF